MLRVLRRASARGLKIALVCAATFATTANARAGVLILENTSNTAMTCQVDGYTVNTGRPHTVNIVVNPNSTSYIGPNPSKSIINWATCGTLTARPLHITPDGPNGTLVFNGQQTRVLNAVMNQQVNIYSFSALPALLGPQGFNVMELDTVMLGYLVSDELINPAHITGDPPLPAALAGSTYDNQLWGVPSWMCNNFIFSGSASLAHVTNLSQLLQFLNSMPSGRAKLAADFNGSWNIPSMYINGYVQTYGYGNIDKAMRMPPDPTVINNLVALTKTCAFDGTNNCINNYYHNRLNGAAEAFAKGTVSNDMGFSEQSFYIYLDGWAFGLPAVTAPFGQRQQPLLYNDAFVTSRATCAPGTNCASDAQALSTLMTSTAMKDYIFMSKDLPQKSPRPWRLLLVATYPFYQQPVIKENDMYQQFVKVLTNGKAYPNNFTPASQAAIYKQVCAAMQAKEPSYHCGRNMTPPHARAEYRK